MTMALNNVKSGVSAKGPLADMSLDIWHLILDQIDDRNDLCNICLTSRAWFTTAITHLYKTVPLAMRAWDLAALNDGKDPLRFARSVSRRLLDTKYEHLRNAVHELDYGEFHGERSSEMEKRLLALVDSLPNLQRVKIRGPLSQEALQGLEGHSKRISIYLLGEDGKRKIETQLQNVVALGAVVNPFRASKGPNLDILDIQKLLFACPNLTSFSLGVTGNYGGCVRSRPHAGTVYSFEFSGDETFPPLEELSLSGYRLDEDEWEYWQEKYPWSKLRALTLGPRYQANFLNLAAGYIKSLRNLTVQVYTDADLKIKCSPLKNFLWTFTSLESLIVKGYYLTPGPIGNHPGLKHLCLHSFEPMKEGITRLTLDVEQLQELDKNCPYLETLEIDLNRDGEWPEDLLKALAAGFRNLRRLTLHLELGLKSVNPGVGTDVLKCIYMEPALNENSAREVGQRFFKWRSSSKLNVLVLKTGEPLRRYPQWEPFHSTYERHHQITIEVYNPWKAENVYEKQNQVTFEVYNPWNTGGVPKVAIIT
ncbi:hypothetical protein F5Y12DRAFT_757987 [Xylaria sp. FL1777]|nr:hypothetical protein F5Y12DRAFT_757987 [Xylaria sp. FL1777]